MKTTSLNSLKIFDKKHRKYLREEVIRVMVEKPNKIWTRKELAQALDVETATMSGIITPMIRGCEITVSGIVVCSVSGNNVEGLQLHRYPETTTPSAPVIIVDPETDLDLSFDQAIEDYELFLESLQDRTDLHPDQAIDLVVTQFNKTFG